VAAGRIGNPQECEAISGIHLRRGDRRGKRLQAT
jgi:hypothetical protein